MRPQQDDSAAHEQFLKMTRTPVQPLILRLAAPTICSMMITAFYNMADTLFVARIGTSAAGAVGVVFSLMSMIQAIGFMCGMGSGSIASRALGAERNDYANQAASSAFFFAVAVSAVFALFGLAFLDRFMLLLGSTETVLPYARRYAQWILLGAPIMAASFVMNNELRAEGKAFFAMLGIGTGGILNVLLDPLFIFGFKMGIAGAAIATVLSQCISFTILMSHFVFGRTVLKINIKHASRSPSFYLLIVRTGLPTLFRQGLGAVSSMAMNINAAMFGDAALAAMAIVLRVSMFIGSMVIGYGQGFQPVAGYNYGARRFDRVIEAYKFTVKTASIALICVSSFFFALAPEIIGLFQKADPRVAEIAVFAFRVNCITMLMMPCISTTDMLFQVTGRYKESSFLAGARRGFFFIPLVCILPRLIGVYGIQLSQPFSDLICACLAIPMARRYISWMRAQPLAESEDSPKA